MYLYLLRQGQKSMKTTKEKIFDIAGFVQIRAQS